MAMKYIAIYGTGFASGLAVAIVVGSIILGFADGSSIPCGY